MTLVVDVANECEAWASVPGLDAVMTQAVEAAHGASGLSLLEGAEVSVLLCDDARIRTLNREWRGIDTSTNVLSFPASVPPDLAQRPLLGDIALAWETTRREASDEGKTLDAHVAHLVVHGVLHLLGFDHLTPNEADAMEAIEIRALATLGMDNPYANLDLAETHTR